MNIAFTIWLVIQGARFGSTLSHYLNKETYSRSKILMAMFVFAFDVTLVWLAINH